MDADRLFHRDRFSFRGSTQLDGIPLLHGAHAGALGTLTPFFAVAIGGVFVLGATNIALGIIVRNAYWSEQLDTLASAAWLSLVVLWVAALIVLRGREPVRKRNFQWAIPAGFCVVSLIWLRPLECYFALVYLHPLLALVFLDREIKNQRPQWRGAYHLCLAAVPLLLCVLWWKLHNAAPLPDDNELALRIARHAVRDCSPACHRISWSRRTRFLKCCTTESGSSRCHY